MDANAWKMKGPLDGDVAFIVGAVLTAGALIGAVAGVAVDVLIHRHKARR